MVTAATVGYGDRVPLTTGGRLVGVLVTVFGVGLVGMVTGRIASWLVEWQIKEGSGLSTQKKTKGHFIKPIRNRMVFKKRRRSVGFNLYAGA